MLATDYWLLPFIHHFRRPFYTQNELFDSPPTLCYHHADSLPDAKTRY
jgi:hypothetical protein